MSRPLICRGQGELATSLIPEAYALCCRCGLQTSSCQRAPPLSSPTLSQSPTRLRLQQRGTTCVWWSAAWPQPCWQTCWASPRSAKTCRLWPTTLHNVSSSALTLLVVTRQAFYLVSVCHASGYCHQLVHCCCLNTMVSSPGAAVHVLSAEALLQCSCCPGYRGRQHS